MRILLIIPTSKYKAITDFPAGFAYLASALRNGGHQVFGLNLNNDVSYASAFETVDQRIRRSLQEVQPGLVGLGGLCVDFKFLKDAIKIIRELTPDVPIVCGGGIINNDARFVFDTLRPDFCIIGEGEEIIVKLANMLEGGSTDYEQIPNLGYWQNGAAQFTRQDFNYIDINKRCFPDYEPFGIKEILDNYSITARYLYRYTRPNPRPMQIVTARGCPFSCTFCVHQGGPRYRARSVENIMQEIAESYERYHFNILIILDELFAVKKQGLMEFCNSLLEGRERWGWDFDWIFQTHASASLDKEVLELAKKSGAYFFAYGLESASPRVLASMNKRTKPFQIIEAIQIANDVGIGFGGNFIFGDIAEDEITISETMEFFLSYCLDNHIFLGSLQPYPGSELFEIHLARGTIRDKLEFYETIGQHPWNMTSMPDKLWLRWIDLLIFFSGSFPWVKSTYASHYIKDYEPADSPPVSYTGAQKRIYKVWAKCPHCGKDIYYRELLDLGEVKGAAEVREAAETRGVAETRGGKRISFISRFIRLINQLFHKALSIQILIKHPVKIISKLAVLYFLSFRQPIFKLLWVAMKSRKRDLFVDSFFVTGCPHCNKRIKISFPIKDVGFKKIKRKLMLRAE